MTTTTTLADDLRHLADLIDANPDITLRTAAGLPLNLFTDRAAGFVDRIRQLTRFGTATKERSADRLTVRVRVNPSFELVAIDYAREVACERIQVGVETVEQPIMEQVGIETVEQPVYEWICPESILAGSVAS